LIRFTQNVRRGSPCCARLWQPDSVSNVIEIKMCGRKNCY
jgi:hypothetical protein